MRWRGRRQSANVEDRRGTGGGGVIRVGRAGGGGIGILIIAVVLWLVFGINPLALLGDAQVMAPSEQSAPRNGGGVATTESEVDDFVATVLADTEDVWGAIFRQGGSDYPEPTLVLFEGQVRSACGFAGAATGPFYCPGDQRLYIDLSFFEELRRRFDAPGDFAQAYVIAHEVGHHVQNVLGILPKTTEMRRRLGERESNALSVRVELQADCFAGIWANRTAKKGYLEEGDIREALNAAGQLGDDMIQRRTQGYVVPDAFNHGSAEQRATWFRRGYERGTLDACDTFQDLI
ncbi:KPN_02809 family neutral zinc metallopeptidase [Afifella pfennigii]|uniref:KPN_02809 family neutral zinc metallopeptidase n=1 Tax=Afifella pfennigii TaxID=209897 RepID=UPI00047D8E39|nr:neutral zinc metallopeptidase [Afifella pfennigii]